MADGPPGMDTGAEPHSPIGHVSGGRVLDAATGYGRFISYLIDGLKDHEEIVGIDTDASEAAAFGERWHDHPEIRFELMDALHPTFPDASFDTVSVGHSLCQFETPEPILARLSRLIRSGGHLIVAAEYRDLQPEPAMTHVLLHDWWVEVDRVRRVPHWDDLRRDQLVALFSGLGLTDLRLTDSRDDGDPADPTQIAEIDGVIDRSIARVEGHPDLQARGEVLRARMHEVGFLKASTLVAVGQIP